MTNERAQQTTNTGRMADIFGIFALNYCGTLVVYFIIAWGHDRRIDYKAVRHRNPKQSALSPSQRATRFDSAVREKEKQ